MNSALCLSITGFFLLFQFCEDFIGTHAFGKQLFQNGFRFCFLCFFCSLGISDRLFPFQRSQLFLGRLKSHFLLFQVSFQSADMLTEKINAIFPLYHSIFFQPPTFS